MRTTLFARTLEEAIEMLDLLKVELHKVGLDINETKTKILTTDAEHACSDSTLLVESGDSFVEVLRRCRTHKYFAEYGQAI